MSDFKLLPAGDTALIVEFGNSIDRDINALVLALAANVAAARIPGVIETVTTFRSLMISYEPLTLPYDVLCGHIRTMARGQRYARSSASAWKLPVCYDAEMAPDLQEVASRLSMSSEQVIERHCATTYHVYMLGFLPGQAYMGDMPPELHLPRRATPRTRIPAGSLAIATSMTCVFPMETPCGWHLIGRSPVPLWNRRAGSQPLLAPGDQVTFVPISMRELDAITQQVAAGVFELRPGEHRLEHAA